MRDLLRAMRNKVSTTLLYYTPQVKDVLCKQESNHTPSTKPILHERVTFTRLNK